MERLYSSKLLEMGKTIFLKIIRNRKVWESRNRRSKRNKT